MSPKHKAAKPQRMSKMMAMAGVLALLVAFAGIITAAPTFASEVVSLSQCPDGTDPGDVNGDGATDEADCDIVVVTPDHPSGDVSVVARCGSVVVTNNEDGAMLFEYGSFGSLDGPDKIDGKVKVRSGASATIKTARRSLDWHASWEFGGLTTRGIDLKVAQDCGPKPATVDQVEHPIAAPHAGGAEGGSGLVTSLKLAGFSLIFGALLFGARRRRTGEA